MGVMKQSENIALRVTTVMMCACTLFVTGVVAHRQFFDNRANALEATPIDNWDDVISGGHRIGPLDAKVTVVEFSDFQCPFCREFATGTLGEVRRRFPKDVAVVYRHWPLSIHQWAYPAARAAECAAEQGRFIEFHDLLFAKQDSIGSKPFVGFALESGITNLDAFESCTEGTQMDPAIEEDIRLAKAVGGLGTPTVVVNGIRFLSAPDAMALDSIVRSLGGRN